MALSLNPSRLRLTTANRYGIPTGSGSISLTEGAGITLNPDPITGAGSIALTVPVGVVNGGTGTTTAFTQGSVVFAGAAGVYSQSNANFFWDGANFRLGLGTATPISRLHIAGTTDATSLGTFERASGDTSSPNVQFLKERGTLAVPVAVNTADSLGQLVFKGWGGASGYVSAASITGFATGTIADTRVPGQLSFWTGTDALPSVLTERMTITNAGYVGVGTNAPNELFQVVDATGNASARVKALNGAALLTIQGGAAPLQSRIDFVNLTQSWQIGRGPGTGADDFGIYNGTIAFPSLIASAATGYVGIGTTSPARYLDVSTSGSIRGKIQDYGGRVISVDAYGAVADGVLNDSADVPVGTPNLTLNSVGASDGFSTSDIGKTIAVAGAGASGGVLTTTIAAVGGGAEGQKASCTLNTVALTECIDGRAVWGTDNKTAIQNAINANVDRQEGHTIELSTGNYLVSGEITFTNEQTSFIGQGKGSSRLFQISTTANTLTVPFTAANMEFRNFSIWGMGAKCTGGNAIGWDSGFGPYFQCLASNVQVKDVYTAFYCDYSGANGMTFDNVQVIGTSSDSIRWDGGVEATTVLVYQYVEQPTASITVGTDDFTLTSGTITSRAVGKKIGIYGAGGSATTPLIGTITEVTSGTTGTISVVATSTAVAQPATIEYPAPSCWHTMNGAPLFRDVHLIGGDYGLYITPDTGDNVSWIFADVLDCDSNRIHGMYVAPTGTGTAQMYQINNSWFSSSASGGWAGRSDVTAGIKFVGQAGTPINGMSFSDCTIGHNGKYGVHSNYCHNLNFDSCVFDTNSTLAANTYDHLNIDNCGVFSLKGSSLGSRYSTLNGGVPINCRYGLVMSANVLGHIIVSDNSFNQFGTGAMSDSSPSATKMVNDNPGLNPMAIVTPAVPATTVAASNTTGSDLMVYIVTDGATTVTVIAINGTTTGMTMPVSSQKSMLLPSGGTITLTYAGGTPTWTWIGS